MLFISFEFLYLFLPLCVLGYYAILSAAGSRSALLFLVICSFSFYAWWNYKYLAILALSIVFNYWAGHKLRVQPKKQLLTFAVLTNLTLLGYFKYLGFFTEILTSIADLSISVDKVVLPLAISFFTFQQIAWLVDSYQGKVDTSSQDFLSYCLFISFFPQLISGPIVHNREMMPQFSKLRNLRFSAHNFAAGSAFFILGLGKKVIIADNLAPIADKTFLIAESGNLLSIVGAWVGVLSYTLQIYFDFSAYADMAIGLGLMFNIVLPLNFNSPYKAVSIQDFWRRWHITLGRFLREYVYIPLGGNRKSSLFHFRNLMLTMLLGGLWHGAAWTFVLWGAVHGSLLLTHTAWRKYIPYQLPPSLAWTLTFLCITFTWVIFRSENLESCWTMLQSMINISPSTLGATEVSLAEYISVAALLVLALSLPNTQELLSKMASLQPSTTAPFADQHAQDSVAHSNERTTQGRMSRLFLANNLYSLLVLSAIAVCSVVLLLANETVNEFIYFQF